MNHFLDNKQQLFKLLNSHNNMVLSTSFKNHVTSRMMSVVIIENEFYFQTDKNSRKVAQLKENTNVALCVDNIQIEGECIEVGKPNNNEVFCEVFKQYYKGSYNAYSHLESERLFKVKPIFIQRWIYEEQKPFIENFDFINSTYEKVAYKAK